MTTAVAARREATLEDLYRIKEKAELVNGEIIIMPPTGDEPSYASLATSTSLLQRAKNTH